MNFRHIALTTHARVAHITLNRPATLNSLSLDCVHELREALAFAARNEAVGAVTLTGAGRAFCAGGDIGEMIETDHTAASALAHMENYRQLTQELMVFEKPIVAAVNGVAAGGGFSLALLCDLIVLSDRARFRSAFRKIGLIPDLGIIPTLTRVVGPYRAKEIFFTDRFIEPEECLRLGLANQVVPHEQLIQTSTALAEEIASGPRLMLQSTKRLVSQSMDSSREAALAAELNAQVACFLTEDHAIAKAAFRDRPRT